MKVAILIGFYYVGCEKTHALPSGTIVDLYLAYMRAIKMGADKILVITDHATEITNKVVMNMVLNGDVDHDLIYFIDTIRANNQYHVFHNVAVLLATLRKLVEGCTKLFFYYTGHAGNGVALFPEYRHHATYVSARGYKTHRPIHYINLDFLIVSLTEATQLDSQIFVVLDCCGDPGLSLWFEFCGGYAVLRRHLLDRPQCYGHRRVVCICSSKRDESVIATMRGSDFSYNLFDLLSRHVDVTLEQIRNAGMILVSHPNLKEIWRWITTKTNVTITYDRIRQLFLIPG